MVSPQFLLSYQLIQKNISPQGTKPGAIVAAISRQHPNYWYSWVRDSALTMNVFTEVKQFVQNHTVDFPYDDNYVQQAFQNYASFVKGNQETETPSARLNANLGEPKFNVDGSAYWGEWGRPQNDGPALRVVTLFNHWQSGGQQYYSPNFNSIMKRDCEYTASKYHEASWDLWEEVNGHHFYNQVVYVRALENCAYVAELVGDHGAARYYTQQIPKAKQLVHRHVKHVVIQTIDKIMGPIKSSNLDIATILAILHTRMRPGDVIYASHPSVQNTVYELHRGFQQYRVNGQGEGYAYGRYPEDIYDGYGTSIANPWFLATAAVAEYYYTLVEDYMMIGQIEVVGQNEAFFRHLIGFNGPLGVYKRGDDKFDAILRMLMDKAEAQMKRFLYHGGKGHFSEQFNRDTGFMQGAEDLTWSHASFVTAMMKRHEAMALLGMDVVQMDVKPMGQESVFPLESFKEETIQPMKPSHAQKPFVGQPRVVRPVRQTKVGARPLQRGKIGFFK